MRLSLLLTRLCLCDHTQKYVSKGKTMRVLYPGLTDVQVGNCAVGVQTQARILCLEGVPHSSPSAGVLSRSGQSAAVAHAITMGLCEHCTAMREPSTAERVGGWGGQRREQVPPGVGERSHITLPAQRPGCAQPLTESGKLCQLYP